MEKASGRTEYYFNIVNTAWLIFFIVLALSVVFIATYYETKHSVERDYICYISHVQECLYAHSQNATYLLCSGFSVEPSQDDLDTFCSIHPNEDCWNTIPMECLLK